MVNTKKLRRLAIAMLWMLALSFTSYCFAKNDAVNDEDKIHFTEMKVEGTPGAINTFIYYNGNMYAGTDKGLFILQERQQEDEKWVQVDNKFKGIKITALQALNDRLIVLSDIGIFSTQNLEDWDDISIKSEL